MGGRGTYPHFTDSEVGHSMGKPRTSKKHSAFTAEVDFQGLSISPT